MTAESTDTAKKKIGGTLILKERYGSPTSGDSMVTYTEKELLKMIKRYLPKWSNLKKY